MVETTLAALALTGFLGGLGHCTGMCGPLVALAAIKLAPEPHRADGGGPARRDAVVASTLAYHAARVAVYAALGAISGAVGSLLGLAGGLSTVGAAVSIVLGVGGARRRGGLCRAPAPSRPTATARAGGRVPPPGRSGGPGSRRAFLLGALNGLLPCGLVYGALLVAAGTGTPGGGALAMLVFGVATLPALVIIQAGASLFAGRRRTWLMRVAAFVMFLAGIQLCLRGLASLGVVPSVHLGGLMLW